MPKWTPDIPTMTEIERLRHGIREIWSLAQFDYDSMPEPSRRKFREVVEELAAELLEPNA
jgi:hypothetical protein